MKYWFRQYMKSDIAERYKKRRITIKMFKIFEYFTSISREKKSLLFRLQKFQPIHSFYLKQKSF